MFIIQSQSFNKGIKMGKHAYLIQAYNNFEFVEKLLAAIDDSRNDIFLHIDKKASNVDRKKLAKNIHLSNLTFVDNVEVFWGRYSQITSELNLLEAAIKNNHYDYYHLLSGADLPIKSQDYIHKFFKKNNGKEFINFQAKNVLPDKLERVKYYYLFQKSDLRYNKTLYIAQKLIVKLQKIVGINRIRKSSVKFQMGSNWFSITDDLARYVISKKPWIQKTFNFTANGDELFLQTIVENSNFKKRLYFNKYDDKERYEDGPSREANQRLIIWDWTSHKPTNLTMKNHSQIMDSDLLFARKFVPDLDTQIIEEVLKSINHK